MIRCQPCRYGLIHWHCPTCGGEVQEPGRHCSLCRKPRDSWLGLGALLAMVVSWYFALTALHAYLTGGH